MHDVDPCFGHASSECQLRNADLGRVKLLDFRFRALLGEDAWARLPVAVQRRFSKRLTPGHVVLYHGRVVATRMNLAGRIFSVITRLIGSPLPRRHCEGGAAVVTVSEAGSGAGQIWTRTYCDGGQFPQVIHSEKRFAGSTGLEEHIGYGIGMRLKVGVVAGALVFSSAGYFFCPFAHLRISIPQLLSPGRLEVIHRDEKDGSFIFEMKLTHRVFGRLVSQIVRFHDVG